eukprot:CAMPEP_0198428090 /NCGR_PEP_ID=MMETSP1452-20131203/6331_1 /TAXON_ID=1181717 /ORGANISM="Synchroma pusillum, Strain CCMP3072" /LENGTH=203 /DNA_ID=CAMNT_0044148477 /DNA_START=72 /DNA_END=683 /DNA_ORIENTATION=+
MMRAVLMAALVVSASAFVTPRAAVAPRASAVKMSAFEDEIGVTRPLGFWDPLGFTAGLTPDNEAYRRRKRVEIKHGRIAMMAVVGYIVPYFVKLPGYISFSQNLKFSDVPAGIDAIGAIPAFGLLQLVVGILALEFWVFPQKEENDDGNTAAGLSFWKRYDDPFVRDFKLTAERNNGRLAMIAIMALMVQDMLTDKGFPFALK